MCLSCSIMKAYLWYKRKIMANIHSWDLRPPYTHHTHINNQYLINPVFIIDKGIISNFFMFDLCSILEITNLPWQRINKSVSWKHFKSSQFRKVIEKLKNIWYLRHWELWYFFGQTHSQTDGIPPPSLSNDNYNNQNDPIIQIRPNTNSPCVEMARRQGGVGIRPNLPIIHTSLTN